MEYNGVILKKFSVLDGELVMLRNLGNVSADALDSDHFMKHGIERSLQICIEIVIDVAQRILSLEKLPPAPTSFDAIRQLENLGIISSAEKYRNMIQFRNFVVHHYERVASDVLVKILNEHLEDLSAFRNEVAGVT